jgi:hypothetical protein
VVTTPFGKKSEHAQNVIAALLTIVPGVGHSYKGSFEAGLLWMLIGMPIAVWVGILVGLATAGVGLLFPILCWVALAFDAYNERTGVTIIRRRRGQMTLSRRIDGADMRLNQAC